MAEADAAGGKALSIGEYATATDTLHRLLTTLGLERRAKDITPTIDRYLARSSMANKRPSALAGVPRSARA
jgi:hypothetical protein